MEWLALPFLIPVIVLITLAVRQDRELQAILRRAEARSKQER